MDPLKDQSSAILEASPVPQALFLSRKLSGANPAFRELFAPVLSRTPKLSLGQLLGRPLAAAAREFLSVTELDGSAARTIRSAEILFPDCTRRTFDLLGT